MKRFMFDLQTLMVAGVLGWAIWELWSWWGLFGYCIGMTVLEMIDRAVSDKT